MLFLKKSILSIGIMVFLFSGCAAENNVRDVSSEYKIFGLGTGLKVEEGDLKESGIIYEDMPIVFQDKVAEEMLRNIIGKPEGDVYISELQKIHAIYWRDTAGYYSNLQSPNGQLPHVSGGEGPWETKQLNSLEDFTYCYNLQWLEFAGGIEIPPLEPLYELTQLETLDFSNAIVTEEILTEIANLPNLKNLRLSDYAEGYGGTNWGYLTDGSFVIPLAEQLIYLDALGNIDWKPEVLVQMTNLESLRIYYAEDLSFLQGMTELKELQLYCCTPRDFTPLGYLEKLEFLDISGTDRNVIDIGLDDLKPLTNLKYLELSFTKINEIHSREEIIKALPSLTTLVTDW